jgi:hypothetical protein
LPPIGGLEVEFLDAVAAYHHHPRFLGVGGVDEHFIGHDDLSARRAKAAPRMTARSEQRARWLGWMKRRGAARKAPSRMQTRMSVGRFLLENSTGSVIAPMSSTLLQTEISPSGSWR